MIDPDILNKCYRYCAYQDRTRMEVSKKLHEWEVNPEDWEEIFSHLEEENFLDEERFAHNFARGKFRIKKWGKMRIRYELQQRGISKELIEKAINQEIEEEEYRLTLRKLCSTKKDDFPKPISFENRSKLIRFLTQKGYELNVIFEEMEWDRDR